MATTKTPEAQSASTPSRKTFTNWQAFSKAGLVPSELTCQGYYSPYHPMDQSCHSRLPFKVENILGHIEKDHGGGFTLDLVESAKTTTLWTDLEQNDLELHEIRCDVCDQSVPVNPQHILKHMKAHQGRSSRRLPGGRFLVTIRPGRPMTDSEEE